MFDAYTLSCLQTKYLKNNRLWYKSNILKIQYFRFISLEPKGMCIRILSRAVLLLKEIVLNLKKGIVKI